MISPGKQIACMIGVHIKSDIYRFSTRRGGHPRHCLLLALAYGSPDSQGLYPYACILPASRDLSMNYLHPTRISGLLGVSLVLPDSQDFFNTLTCPADVLDLDLVVLWQRYLIDWSLYLLWLCDRLLTQLPRDTCGMQPCGDSYVVPTPALVDFCTQLRFRKTYLLYRRLGHQTFSTFI